MEEKVLELVVYRLNDGVTREQFLGTSPAVAAWIAEQPGFVSRDLAYDDDGDRWIDVIWWESMEEAAAASKLSETSESCAPMFALIEMKSMLMLHAARLIPRIFPSSAAVGV